MKNRILKEAGFELNQVNALAIEKAAKAGDGFARQLYRDLGHSLGIGLANLAMLTNPEAIFLGGSVSKALSLFSASLLNSFRQNTWSPVWKKCKISHSQLGNQAGDYGAIALVLHHKAH